MKRLELLNAALELIKPVSHEEAKQSQKAWINDGGALSVSSVELFYGIFEEIYLSEKIIYERFSRKKIFLYLENLLVKFKKSGSVFCQENSDKLFSEMFEIKPKNLDVLAPVSGIRLNSSTNKFSVFEFGYVSELKIPLANDAKYYIKICIKNVYDGLIAISKAINAFDDFARLAVFISGKNDKNVVIKTGLPAYPQISPTLMYVESSSYQILCGDEEFTGCEINSKYVEIVPIDDVFFC